LSQRQLAALAAIVVVLALPASAGAATKVVSMGAPPSSQKKFGLSIANQFFPTGIRIHAGDSIRFVPAGFHNVNLPKKGGGPNALFVPTGQPIVGANDPAGAPYWFNGLPQLGFNPALGANGFGKKFVYTGAKALNSGLPLQDKPKPMTVKFTKTGAYTYYCDVHPGMKAKVTVVSGHKSVPSAKADAKRVSDQIARDLKIGKALTKVKAPPGVVDLGVADKRGVEYFAMVPSKATVPVGTTLTFRMTTGSFEAHTATFGPGNIDDPKSFIGALAGSIEGAPVPDQAALYPSDRPPAPAAFGPALHGNGFWNSGALDAVKASAPPPANAVTFTTPGTYTYYCLIHPFMKGTVVVQ
jgi:plastocyanin